MLKVSQIVSNALKTGRNQPLTRLKGFSTSASIAEAKGKDFEAVEEVKPPFPRTHNNLVAAAFASLGAADGDKIGSIKTPFTNEKIARAKNLNELLGISEGAGVSRKFALNVVSVIAEWSANGKVQISEFENDPRFVKLCRVLTRGAKINRNIESKNEDLTTILSVTADDEAAKLVESITLPQMVKVLTTLSAKKRRSTSLLRALSYQLAASSDCLNLKQCGDVLYSMCQLSFIDENVLTKVSRDVSVELLKDIKKSSAVGSVITSFGLLKYLNTELLDTLSDWVLKNHDICRPQDIFSLFVTLAALDYTPANSEALFQTLLPQMSISEVGRPALWLNLVWSLVLLNKATHEHVSSVLSEDFITRLEANNELSISCKLKLLNVNGAAEYLLENYKGARLGPTSTVYDVSMVRNKDKFELVECVLQTLKNLIKSDGYLSINTNSSYGFIIDAKCLLDDKCTPLTFDKSNEAKPGVIKVAILVLDYHDMCRGKVKPTGVNAFAARILEAQGYRVVAVPYTDFKITDKLIHRVQYLENKLKEVVK